MQTGSGAEVTCCKCHQVLPKGKAWWEFHIDYEIPSQNQAVVNKGNWAQRRKHREHKRAAHLLVKIASREIPKAERRRRVTITRHFTTSPYDWGNLVGGAKQLLDALTDCGVILDDNDDGVEDHYEQERAKKAGTTILVEDL